VVKYLQDHNSVIKLTNNSHRGKLLIEANMTARILIVEDESAIREMLTFVMDQHGFTTAAAEDFDSAIELLAEPYPDLILLDWMFPGGSGIQLAKRLKQDEFTRQIPIIMLTARGEEEDKVKG